MDAGPVAAGEIAVRTEPSLEPLDPELLPFEAGRLSGGERSAADPLENAMLLVPLPLLYPSGFRRERRRRRERESKRRCHCHPRRFFLLS